MDLIMPQFGLFFWTLVIFITFFFLMKKYAWKPILNSIKEREVKIETALHSAEEAEKRMKDMTVGNEKLLDEAKKERDKMLVEAQNNAREIIDLSKTKAHEEYQKILHQVKEAIQNEKLAAMTEIKNQAADISIEIAKRLIMKELSKTEAQKELMDINIKELEILKS